MILAQGCWGKSQTRYKEWGWFIAWLCPRAAGIRDAARENGERKGKPHQRAGGSSGHAQMRRGRVPWQDRGHEAPAGPQYAKWSSSLTCRYQTRYRQFGHDLRFRTCSRSAGKVRVPYREYTSWTRLNLSQNVKMGHQCSWGVRVCPWLGRRCSPCAECGRRHAEGVAAACANLPDTNMRRCRSYQIDGWHCRVRWSF